jgi:cardiolipin synthase (CMP-forming)
VNVPNLISLLRLAAVPLVVWQIATERFTGAFWVFVAAGVSDAIDGYLARILNQRTRLGAYLDPLADKMLLVCVFVTLGQVGKLESWLVILVVSRDVMIVGGIILLFLLEHRVEVAPSFISKANTLVQIAFAGLVLARYGLDFRGVGWNAAMEWASYVVALTTLFSGAHYVKVGLRHLAAADAGHAKR